MPLDRQHTTIGGWTAAVAYPWFLGVVGAALLLTDQRRLRQTPGYDYAARHVPLPILGGIFLAIAALLLIALATKQRRLYQRALAVAMVWLIAWAVVLAAAYFRGQASPAAWAWPAMIVWHMWAVELSLESRQHG